MHGVVHLNQRKRSGGALINPFGTGRRSTPVYGQMAWTDGLMASRKSYHSLTRDALQCRHVSVQFESCRNECHREGACQTEPAGRDFPDFLFASFAANTVGNSSWQTGGKNLSAAGLRAPNDCQSLQIILPRWPTRFLTGSSVVSDVRCRLHADANRYTLGSLLT